jgi:hypothetical protein
MRACYASGHPVPRLRDWSPGGLCLFHHAGRRCIRRRFPGACDGSTRNRRHRPRRAGCGPAFGARLGVLAVPGDVFACLAAIRYQQAERLRDAAQGALGYLQRPEPAALRGRRWFRQRQALTGRRLFRSRFRGRGRPVNCHTGHVGVPPEVGPTQGPGRVLRTPGRDRPRLAGDAHDGHLPPVLAGGITRYHWLSPLVHAYLLPLTSQDNALCTSLWIIRVKWQVSACLAVDDRTCGNVDNRSGAQSCQVAGLRFRL